jgi:hypothetical protein
MDYLLKVISAMGILVTQMVAWDSGKEELEEE